MTEDVIARVELRRYDWPVAAGGAARTAVTRSAIVVAGYDAAGRVAFGEAAPLPGMSRESIDDAHARLAQLAADLQRDPARASTSAEATARLLAPSGRFAIETVQLGLVAIREGIPLHALLAAGALRPSPSSVPFAVVVDSPVDAAHLAASTLKIKIGKHCDDDRVLAIHRAAPAARLRLDANRAWSPDRARTELAAFAGLPIDFVEEPCIVPYFDLPVPVALDESLASMDDAAIDRALAEPNLAALVLKPSLLGLHRSCELARRARAAGKQAIVTHALEGPVGTATCAELALALGPHSVAGLAPHGALAAWATRVPQLAAHAVVPVEHVGNGIAAWPLLRGSP